MGCNEKEIRRAAIFLLAIGVFFILISNSGCGSKVIIGPPGPQGNTGPTGLQGNSGTTGQNGLSVVETSISVTAQCLSNSGHLLTFAQDNARTGQYVVGDTILDTVLVCDGSNGQDATRIRVIQFCPNLNQTVYPNNFPEQGLCIGSILYGVYWTGSEAFLAEIVPGKYISTSPNRCSFTVEDNCVITQE